MTDAPEKGLKKGTKPADGPAPGNPDWAKGLKKLYDSVVEEPLPDSFSDLLSRLDDDRS